MTEYRTNRLIEIKKSRTFFTAAYGAIALLCALLCLTAASCGTFPTNENVPPNLTPTELKQRAQEHFDKGSKKKAIAYYEILITRYGSDVSIRTAAEFEIAHLLIKQKKWDQAERMLKEIIARYETAGGAGITPKYYILAKNDYALIQAQTKKQPAVEQNNEKPSTSPGSPLPEAAAPPASPSDPAPESGPLSE